VAGSVPSTRAWIERSAARGMLSCSPAHAAALSESGPGGSRSPRPPERRRNARTCARVSSSRCFATPPLVSGPWVCPNVDSRPHPLGGPSAPMRAPCAEVGLESRI
jgi:hypothetical protein